MRHGALNIKFLKKHPFLDKLARNSAALLFAICFIAILKVSFGGDWSLVTTGTILKTLLILIPSSIFIAAIVTFWEAKND